MQILSITNLSPIFRITYHLPPQTLRLPTLPRGAQYLRVAPRHGDPDGAVRASVRRAHPARLHTGEGQDLCESLE